MLWDLYQQYQIGQLDQRLDRVQDESTTDTLARGDTRRLEEKLDRLSLICRAMFELMQESSGVSEEKLSAKVLEIDLRDGHADGVAAPQAAKTCPTCGAKISPKFGRCLFCGYRDETQVPFA